MPQSENAVQLGALRPVASSYISEAGYDAQSETYLVKWSGTGKISAYSGVPQQVADSVSRSSSIGRAVRSILQPGYKHQYLSSGGSV